MNNRIDLKKAVELLSERDNYLIVCHSSPDGDTVGSGFALRYILERKGKKAKVVCDDDFPQKFDYFMSENEDFDHETVVLVDVADLKLTGEMQNGLKDNVYLAIDHHGTNKMYAENNLVDPSAAANCEIILSLAEEWGVEISGKLADALYTGICTDTGCFKFSNTTNITHLAAARLFDYGANVAEINRAMFDTKRKEQIELEKLALETLEFFYDNKVAVITITDEMLDSTGCLQSELDAITAVPRSIKGVVAGVTIKQKKEDLFKISLRSKPPVNASDVAAILGGGGHEFAAGCSFSGTADEAKTAIINAFKGFI